ncbi:MAG: hypothetical protein CMC21_02095 [Flavobacteriaceae bacterium]|nr:hypothetical protein [Flavobacteriaceae bacterium]
MKFMIEKNMFPPSITNLLLQEGQRFKNGDYFEEALGTGVIPIVATARGGKTSLAYVMLDYVIRYTKRPVILDSFPQKVLDEGIPEHWKDRVNNTGFEDIAKVKGPAVWLVDDTGTSFNSRDAMGRGKLLARVAGVLSHFGGGMTVIFTTQLLSGVDVSFFRYTNISPVIRFVDNDVLRHERPEWKELILEGQYQLKRVTGGRCLDYFYSAKDSTLVKTVFPEWLDKKHNPVKADLMSRPMRYHSTEDKERMIKSNKGVSKSVTNKNKENLTE